MADPFGYTLYQSDRDAVAKMVWPNLRALRAAPPPPADQTDRRDAFRAALEQSEQLFDAAGRCGHQTSPILLYYAASQGARAVFAAADSLDTHAATANPGHHGVTFRDDLIKESGGGLFATLKSVLSSPGLTSPMTPGDVANVIPSVRLAQGLGEAADTNQRPHAIVGWIALLLGLSSLARYHPVEWSRMIDVDDGDEAALWEVVLSFARTDVPLELLAAIHQVRTPLATDDDPAGKP